MEAVFAVCKQASRFTIQSSNQTEFQMSFENLLQFKVWNLDFESKVSLDFAGGSSSELLEFSKFFSKNSQV